MADLRGEKGLPRMSNEDNDDASKGTETQSQSETGRVQTLGFKPLFPFQIFSTFSVTCHLTPSTGTLHHAAPYSPKTPFPQFL